MNALASIAKRTRSTIVVNAAPHLLNTERRIAHFLGDAGRPEFDFGFWLYSLGVYRHIFAMLGFNITRIVTDEFRFPMGGITAKRSAIVAERGDVIIPFAEPEPDEEVGEAQTELRVAASRISTLEAALARKDAEIAEQARQLAQITSSRSWRLTQPMRRLNALRTRRPLARSA